MQQESQSWKKLDKVKWVISTSKEIVGYLDNPPSEKEGIEALIHLMEYANDFPYFVCDLSESNKLLHDRSAEERESLKHKVFLDVKHHIEDLNVKDWVNKQGNTDLDKCHKYIERLITEKRATIQLLNNNVEDLVYTSKVIQTLKTNTLFKEAVSASGAKETKK